MNPKEKAKELVDKIYETEYCGIKHFPNKNYCDCNEMNYFQTKQCALIAVNELIKETGSKYWYNVKSEIEKL